MDLLRVSVLGLLLSTTSVLAESSRALPTTWADFQRDVQAQIRQDEVLGWSYIVSGGLSLVGGLVGSTLAKDPAEGLVFTLFQNTGVASIGFGYLRLEAGDERRAFYYTLLRAEGLSVRERDGLVRAYAGHSAELERRTRVMKALTTGLLAAVNLYGGIREENSKVKNGLFLIGAVNALACVSFSFDF